MISYEMMIKPQKTLTHHSNPWLLSSHLKCFNNTASCVQFNRFSTAESPSQKNRHLEALFGNIPGNIFTPS
ncbi:CLUMA_CG018610, isoform A [Clunio marinus]|uniref:CLUMA_CG018610, isoform A n=1 Tax=Clunio marinus TaxID=568069 RepID=A0A1J1IXE9_9DIPT|nr:CLUMA_CG018610, isoform A [Clunio marinus]